MRTSAKCIVFSTLNGYLTKMNKRQNFLGLFFQNMVPKEVLSISIYVGFDQASSVYPSPPPKKKKITGISGIPKISGISGIPKKIYLK